MDEFSNYSIVKFGGTSVATPEKIKYSAKLVAEHVKNGRKAVVVVSAMGKTTDELIRIASAAAEDASRSHMDEILSMGERISARVFTAAISSAGAKADFIDIEKQDWPIITDDNFGDANILLKETRKKTVGLIAEQMRILDVLVIPGFVGKTIDGKITTIGRGGSDTTAFVIADSLHAKQVILVSDVSGIMSADPKLIKSPKKIDEVDVRKLIGLADSGAKFLHKKALSHKPKTTDIKLIGNNSESLDDFGTIIKGCVADIDITLVSENAASVTIVGDNISANPGLLADVLNLFREEKIGICGMSADHDNVVFYIPCNGINIIDTYEKLHGLIIKNKQAIAIARRDNLALIMLNGIGLQETPGSISKAATILRDASVNIFGQYTVMSEIFLLVKSEDNKKAIELLKREFVRNSEISNSGNE